MILRLRKTHSDKPCAISVAEAVPVEESIALSKTQDIGRIPVFRAMCEAAREIELSSRMIELVITNG
jgi:hypothetical protein